MIKKLAALCTLLGLVLMAQAQIKNIPGTYVDLEGKTHTGTFPAFENSFANPYQIRFTEDGFSTFIELSPRNTKAVAAGEDYFLPYQGDVTRNTSDFLAATMLNSFDSSRQTTYKEIFLRRVFHSDQYEVYILKTQERTSFFIRHDDQIEELLFWAYRKGGSADYIYQYRDQLAKLPGAKAAKTQRLDYTQRSLTRFLSNLNPGSEAVIDNAQRKKYVLLEVGLSFLPVKNVSGQYSYLYNLDFGSYQSPTIALGYQYFLNRHNRTYLLPRFTGYGFNYTSNAPSVLGYRYTAKASFCLNTDLNIGYNLISKPTLQLGVQAFLGFRFFFNNQLIEANGNSKKSLATGANNNSHFGAGLTIRPGSRLMASLYYSPYNYFTGTGDASLKQQSIQITAGLAF